MVSVEQLIVQFHVDNLKCLYMDQAILDSLVHDLNDNLKTKKKILTEIKGPIHNYLGLSVDYSKKHHAVFTMHNYLEDILEEALMTWTMKQGHL